MGHYCWCCDRHRANERFTGRGHRDHICRDCQRLPEEERQLRQAIRNINRCISYEGFIRRKHRQTFDEYLEDSRDQVRDYAEQCLQQHREEVELRRRLDDPEFDGTDEYIPF